MMGTRNVPVVRNFSLHSVDVSKEDSPSRGMAKTVPPRRPIFSTKGGSRSGSPSSTRVSTSADPAGTVTTEAVDDPPGLGFAKLPSYWSPTCGAAQSFVRKSVEIAGFAQNQKCGFGGNTLTSGQKAFLIYGSLLLAFVLFPSGYFLQ